MNVVSNRNCTYQTAYHIVWCPKYRKQVLTKDVATSLEALLRNICNECAWPIIAIEIQPDHVHLFVSIPPAISVASAIQILKGRTARSLFLKHPMIKNKLWGGQLWSPSYYVGTAGSVSAETIQNYINRLEHVKNRK